MDREEAERLARAIRLMRMEWIKVNEVELNASTGRYEVKCELKQTRKD